MKKTESKQYFGYNIVKTFRTFHDLTQHDVEAETGINQARISRLENMNVDKLVNSLTIDEIERLNSLFNSLSQGTENSFYESVLYHVKGKHKIVNTERVFTELKSNEV